MFVAESQLQAAPALEYQNHYPFPLIPLGYAYSALEPYIDTKTMELHHDRHLKTYVDNLNAALAPYPEFHDWSLELLLTQNDVLPDAIQTAVRNNAGGVYNHNFFFSQLGKSPLKQGSILRSDIEQTFGSFANFKDAFTKAALRVFGSGYAWLSSDKLGSMQISTTANQSNPLELGLQPLFTIDVWEHAYYLKHYNVRADYVADFFKLSV
ncbi:MAG: superoxide dismutase [Clostridiales bacterium]|jgi:Fe-Mn family superoxide dismutase|nr:superoxide dismutase [Clostridiales bacterium]